MLDAVRQTAAIIALPKSVTKVRQPLPGASHSSEGRSVMRTLFAVCVICVGAATASASDGPAVDIPTRAKGAKKVVVATVVDVQATFDVNEYGDRLIVSHALLHIDETMKGTREETVTVTTEGGTVGDLTLKVSDMPVMVKGDRAVMFLDDSTRGGYVPHGRGQGVLKLDPGNRVAGTSLTLDEIRSLVAQGATRQ